MSVDSLSLFRSDFVLIMISLSRNAVSTIDLEVWCAYE